MSKVKYIGPEIKNDATLAALQGRPDYHLIIRLDWENATISIEDRPDHDRSWTVREHHGHEWTHSLDILSRDDAVLLIDALRPLVQQMHDAYSSEWDGSNHVATFGLDEDEREGLVHEIERTITEARVDAVGGVWDAADYLAAAPPEMHDDTDMDALAIELQADAHDDGIHLHDLDDYLEALKDEVVG